MLIRWALAVLHLMGLGVGLGAIWARARGLERIQAQRAVMPQVLAADSWWGVSALVWIGTGLWRLLAGTEKATAWYLGNPVFWTKMGLLLLILVLELLPMVTLIRWRVGLAKGHPVDLSGAGLLARISYLQTGLIVLMVAAATALARGFFQ